jgi:hypothetical protein
MLESRALTWIPIADLFYTYLGLCFQTAILSEIVLVSSSDVVEGSSSF